MKPILDWSSFILSRDQRTTSIEDLKYIKYTTSGRAAIYHALLQLRIPPGSIVLAPSYHCPTMIAPIILAGLKVAYFSISDLGLPNLDSIDNQTLNQTKAILVSHYFGIPNSLHEVRNWCDKNKISLIEDCAHCYYGNAGERTVGHWGDYSTASLSKFFPVVEGGILASNIHPISQLNLKPTSAIAEIKGWFDIFDTAQKYGGFKGLNRILSLICKTKYFIRKKNSDSINDLNNETDTLLNYCDLRRIDNKLISSSFILRKYLPKNYIIKKRRINYLQYENKFKSKVGACPLFPTLDYSELSGAPYVFPLWVNDANRIYKHLRKKKLPVFRWDKVWPGTPRLINDSGPDWSMHVLQLLCHQNLDEEEIDFISTSIIELL